MVADQPGRTLYILRHAKSAWSPALGDDFERPLAPRGRRATPLMAAYLARLEPTPALVLCSSARRAVETWKLIAPALSDDIAVAFDDDLYLASAATLLARLRRVPGTVPALLLIGHEPGLGRLATRLASEGERAARTTMAAKFPTAALAVLRFDDGGWTEIGAHRGRLIAFVTPRDLAADGS